MACDYDNGIIVSINLDHVISDVDSEVEDQRINFMTKGGTNISPLCFLEDTKHGNDIVFMNEIPSLTP